VAAHWRPDPAKGVFETLLVLDGRPVEPDAHLARLRASLDALYPDCAPPDLDVPAIDRPRGGSTTGAAAEAMRITVAPSTNGRLTATVASRPAPGEFPVQWTGNTPVPSIALGGAPIAGGLGPHKWADRSLLNEVQAGLPDGALPLIVDGDEVLEASRANVFAVRDGALFTPPLDGRILPGVTRMRVLQLAATLGIETCEEPLSRGDLRAADEVFLTGALRGIEQVDSLDGAALTTRNDAADRISSELWRCWKRDAAALKSPEQNEREAGEAEDQARRSRHGSRVAALRGAPGRGRIAQRHSASSGPR